MTVTSSQMSSDQSSTEKKQSRRRPIPTQPAKIMIASILAGLEALVRLAEQCVSSHPEVSQIVDEIKSIWMNARKAYKKQRKKGALSFSFITSIEHNLRKKYLDIIWMTTISYGNTEEKRVYRWSEGTIGPLNQLLNFAGAMLRSIAMKFYSFPKVTYFQVREFPDGTIKILHRSTAKKYPAKKGVKKYYITGYSGNSRCPMVQVKHSTLPEMDFVDMIRAHVIELVRHCFIYNVPRKTSHRYIRLLIYRLQPFLDWVYSNGSMGKKDFLFEADKILEEIVMELRAHYEGRIGFTPRLTHQVGIDYSYKSTLLDLVRQTHIALKQDSSIQMQEMVWGIFNLMGYSIDEKNKSILYTPTDSIPEMKKKILKLVEKLNAINEFNRSKSFTVQKTSTKSYLTDDDVQEFYDKMQYATQREGNDWHRVLLGDMCHPSSLKQAIYVGDNFLDEETDIMITAEVPILTSFGSGKADLVVFIRRAISGEAIWTPIMVLDVKTKMGIDWSIIGKKPRTKKKDVRIPSFDIWKRELTSSEWVKIIDSTPSRLELEQITRYEQGIVTEYASLVKQDPSAPKHLWKGIMLLDPAEDQEDLFKLLPGLIKAVLTEIKKGPGMPNPRMLYRPHLKGIGKKFQHKFGLVLTGQNGPKRILNRTVTLEKIIRDDPFEGRDKEQRIRDRVHFTLYLTVASADSSGESAAWIARNWHLLNHLSDLKREQDKIVWLDLAGELTDPFVRKQRLRLIGDQQPKRVTRRTSDPLRRLADSVDFHDLSEALKMYFFDNSQEGIKELEARFKQCIQGTSEDRQIIVLDGWSQIWRMIPTHLNSLVRALENRLLEWLPKKDVEVIWLDRPVPLPFVSATYQLHRVAPLPYDSPRRRFIDDIIWNLPSSPRNLGWRTPRREDIRLIAKDAPTKNSIPPVPFGVPQLKGWAKRFRADSKKDRMVSEEEAMGSKKESFGRIFSGSSDYYELGQVSMDIILKDIYQLVPSLSRNRGGKDELPSSTREWDSSVEVKSSDLKSAKKTKGLWERTTFVTDSQHKRLGRPGTYSPLSEVTRWKIRRPLSKPEKVSRTTRRPPIVGMTPAEYIDTEYTRKEELLRIKKTAEFLLDKFDKMDSGKWYGVLEETINICISCLQDKVKSKKALDWLESLYKRREVSMDLWKDLSSERRFIRWKRIPNSAVQNVIRKRPELMTRYGNALFLLVRSVVIKGEPKNWKPFVPILWRAVADWQWTHMGFIPRDDLEGLVRSIFDPSALWSNLLWRAQHLASGPEPPILFESHRFGQIIPLDEVQDEVLYIFQASASSSLMIAGVLTGGNRSISLRGTYDTVLDVSKLAESAEVILDNEKDGFDIVITRFEGKEILWEKVTAIEDDREWNARYIFKYQSPKKGRIAPIRKFTFSAIPYKVIERIIEPREITIPEFLKDRVDDTLRQIIEYGEKSISVKVKVTLDAQKERYLVSLHDENGDLLESLEFEMTDEVIGFLRTPISRGKYYQLEDGYLCSWDIKKDVSYGEIETPTGVLDTSFLSPLVYHSSFLDGKYIIPRTAKDALETKLGDEVLLVASPDLERYRKGWKRCWIVWFLNTEIGNRLKQIENILMTIDEVASLFECEQILCPDTGLRHPTTIAVNKLEDVTLHSELISQPRLKTFLDDKRVLKI